MRRGRLSWDWGCFGSDVTKVWLSTECDPRAELYNSGGRGGCDGVLNPGCRVGNVVGQESGFQKKLPRFGMRTY